MTETVIVSGAGDYADPWHRFAATSRRLATLLESCGHTVAVRDDVDKALAGPGECDLLVVNIGNPSQPRPLPVIEAINAGLKGHLAAGGSLLGIHVAATSLTQLASWSEILGGRWIRGHTMHPPQGNARILIGDAHPVTSGLSDFDIFDERYSYLRVEPGIAVLAEHLHDGIRHPVTWAHEVAGARVAYDGLGHDAASYDSPGHVALLTRTARWLLRDL